MGSTGTVADCSPLLERMHRGEIEEVVVTHKYRLAQVARELMEWILRQSGTKLVVLDYLHGGEEEHNDLTDDLLSIITYFVTQHNGRRSAKNRCKCH